jgi:hypothetical protein
LLCIAAGVGFGLLALKPGPPATTPDYLNATFINESRTQREEIILKALCDSIAHDLECRDAVDIMTTRRDWLRRQLFAVGLGLAALMVAVLTHLL